MMTLGEGLLRLFCCNRLVTCFLPYGERSQVSPLMAIGAQLAPVRMPCLVIIVFTSIVARRRRSAHSLHCGRAEAH